MRCVLEDFENTRGERYGTIRVEGGGVAVTLEKWDDWTGLPSRGEDGKPCNKRVVRRCVKFAQVG